MIHYKPTKQISSHRCRLLFNRRSADFYLNINDIYSIVEKTNLKDFYHIYIPDAECNLVEVFVFCKSKLAFTKLDNLLQQYYNIEDN